MSGANANMPAVAVTGAASGIGRAVAELFLERGWAVAALDLDDRLAARLTAPMGTPRLTHHVHDVSDAAAVAQAFATIDAEHGGLRALVAAAAIDGPGPIGAIDVRDWDHCIAVALRGTMLCAQAAAPLMRGGGAIVTFGSILGRATHFNGGAYEAAKAGIEALTRSLAVDLARDGIRANCIVPGPIDTPMMWHAYPAERIPQVRRELSEDIPLGRIGEPADVARAVWFLASDEAAFVTGTQMVVDGGVLARIASRH